MTTTYSIIGLGKLGASMAAAIASRGFPVIGVDVSQRAVDLVNAGQAPVQETNLAALIAANRARLRATLSHREAILNSDVTFVIVPTPSDARGAFSLQYAAWAFREIGRALAEKSTYHLVVLTSTVLPGAMRYGLLPILEHESGKTCGPDFGLCYSPEFIALGSIIRDFLNPDFTLVGEYDERAGAQLSSVYAAILENGAPCQRMSLENAELTKIALNTFVTTKITFANMLADLCERLPGGNVDVVTQALGFDRRIGPKYLTGGLGYGGPCFPRDNVALGFLARVLDTRADLAETTHQVNLTWPNKWAERVRALAQPGDTVAVLGLAYKPASHVIEASQSIDLVRALSQTGFRVVAYDPLAADAARAELHDQAVVLDSLTDCLSQANIVLITTPDPEFRELTAADFGAGPERPVIVVDFWRLLARTLPGEPDIRYLPVGYGQENDSASTQLATLWKMPH